MVHRDSLRLMNRPPAHPPDTEILILYGRRLFCCKWLRGMEITGLYRLTGRILDSFRHGAGNVDGRGCGRGPRLRARPGTVMFLTVLMVRRSSRISLYWQCAPRKENDPQNGLLSSGERIKVRGFPDSPRSRTWGTRHSWSHLGTWETTKSLRTISEPVVTPQMSADDFPLLPHNDSRSLRAAFKPEAARRGGNIT